MIQYNCKEMISVKLRRWVKVALTILVGIVSIYIYSKVGEYGKLAQNENIYLFACVMSWLWLFVIQFVVLAGLWGE